MATFTTKWPKRIATGLLAIVALYLLTALFGSIFPSNPDWKSPDDGIELFIETNGLHTGIVMPLQSDVHDWSDLIRADHLADPSRYGSHILIGWGHEGVYRNAEYWQDLRFRDAASAIFGSDQVLLHVYHLRYPQAYPHYRRGFTVTREEYRKMVDLIEARFVRDASGAAIPSRGYGADDLFYDAKGHYNAFYTCNNWTNDVLKRSGVRTGLWTPFQGGVMRWFLEESD